MAASTSVIMVSFQTGPALWIALYRLLQLDRIREVVLVNNGNPVEVELHMARLATAYPDKIRLVTGQGNVGFAKGCNLGAEAARGQYLLILNPDAVILEPDAILKFERVANQITQPAVGAIGAVLRNEDWSEQRATRRNILTPANALLEGLGLWRLKGIPCPSLNIRPEDVPLPAEAAPLPAISGACIFIEKTRYLALKGMDEGYFLHVEDMDFCKRIHDVGGSVWIQPQVNLLHYCSTSDVSSVVVERNKAAGFYRYFNLHFPRDFVFRPLIQAAVGAKLSGRILQSFFEDDYSKPRLKDARGIRMVQAIVRGAQEAIAEMKEGTAPSFAPQTHVLVTGAHRSTALFAIGRLLTYGCKVTALTHNRVVGFFHPNLTWMNGEIRRKDEIRTLLAPLAVDYVYHAAPLHLACNLLEALGKVPSHFVAFSRVARPLNPKQNKAGLGYHVEYEEHENSLRNLCKKQDVSYTIIRHGNLYGGGLDQDITRLAEWIDKSHMIFVDKESKGRRAPLHADDLALAALRSFHTPQARNRVYGLQGGEAVPFDDMLVRIFKVLDLFPKVFPVASLEKLALVAHSLVPLYFPPQRLVKESKADWLLDDRDTRQELRVNPRPFLRDGSIDLGVGSEAVCRKLIPV